MSIKKATLYVEFWEATTWDDTGGMYYCFEFIAFGNFGNRGWWL